MCGRWNRLCGIFEGPWGLAGVAIGVVADLSGAGGGYSRLHGRVGLLTGVDAFKEISHVRVGAVVHAVFFENGILIILRVFAVDAEAAAVDLQGGFVAAEFKAAVVDGRTHHSLVDDVEAGIAKGGLDGVGAVPLFEDVFVGEHLRLARCVGLHGPVHDVDPVSEEVGHGTAAEVPIPAPAIKLINVERLGGRGTEPRFPIECLRVDRLGLPIARVILPPVGADLGDASEAAALDEIDCILKVRPAALLHAALQNLLAGAHGFREGGTLFDGVRDGLFEIDIFAGGNGVDGHGDVPVVGRRDEDGIDLFTEHLVIINVGGGKPVGARLDGIAARAVDVADGDDLNRANFVSSIEQGVHAAACSDDSYAKRVVGAEDAGGGEGG